MTMQSQVRLLLVTRSLANLFLYNIVTNEAIRGSSIVRINAYLYCFTVSLLIISLAQQKPRQNLLTDVEEDCDNPHNALPEILFSFRARRFIS